MVASLSLSSNSGVCSRRSSSSRLRFRRRFYSSVSLLRSIFAQDERHLAGRICAWPIKTVDGIPLRWRHGGAFLGRTMAVGKGADIDEAVKELASASESGVEGWERCGSDGWSSSSCPKSKVPPQITRRVRASFTTMLFACFRSFKPAATTFSRAQSAYLPHSLTASRFRASRCPRSSATHPPGSPVPALATICLRRSRPRAKL